VLYLFFGHLFFGHLFFRHFFFRFAGAHILNSSLSVNWVNSSLTMPALR